MVAASSGNAIDISNRNIALSTSDIWHEFKRHTSVDKETSRGQIAFTKRQFQNAVKCIISPDMVETIFADANNPTQRQSFAYAKKTVRGHYVVVEAVGGKKNPQIYPVMIVQFSKSKWNKMMAEGKSLGEILHESEPGKLQAQDVEKNKKSRVTAAQFASYEAIANTLRSPQLDTKISQPDQIVNSESAEAMDVELDTKTESVAPAVLKSERTNYSDRDFFADGVKSNYTVSEISEMFDAWNSEPELEDLAKKVFAKLEEIISKQKDEQGKNPLSSPNPYSIAFVRKESFVRPYLDIPHGSFVPAYGIYYNIDHFMEFSDQEKAHVLLHEAIHACTYIAIASAEWKIPQFSSDFDVTPDDSWSEEQKAGLTLIQTFNQVRTINNVLDRVYGQKSVYEMVAEMSNPEFRAMLKKHRLWDRIVDAIKRIFGITQRTAYDAVSYGLEKILELVKERS